MDILVGYVKSTVKSVDGKKGKTLPLMDVGMDAGTVRAVEAALQRGERVELVPTAEGRVKALRVRREALK